MHDKGSLPGLLLQNLWLALLTQPPDQLCLLEQQSWSVSGCKGGSMLQSAAYMHVTLPSSPICSETTACVEQGLEERLSELFDEKLAKLGLAQPAEEQSVADADSVSKPSTPSAQSLQLETEEDDSRQAAFQRMQVQRQTLSGRDVFWHMNKAFAFLITLSKHDRAWIMLRCC